MKENFIERKSSFESSVFSLGSAGHPLLLPGSYFLVSLFFFSGVCWKKQNIRNKIFGRKRYRVLSNIIIIVIKINRIFLWPKDLILQQGKGCRNFPCYLLRAPILFCFVFFRYSKVNSTLQSHSLCIKSTFQLCGHDWIVCYVNPKGMCCHRRWYFKLRLIAPTITNI